LIEYKEFNRSGSFFFDMENIYQRRETTTENFF